MFLYVDRINYLSEIINAKQEKEYNFLQVGKKKRCGSKCTCT
jgi:hypothetical protein